MRRCWLAVLCWGVTSLAAAQTAVINPTTIEFVPSADHSTMIDGQPMVASYEARFLVVGTTTVAGRINLGKPTPVAGVVSMPLNITSLPLSASTRYYAYVAALGPTGEGVSGPSSTPFLRAGPPGAPSTVVVSRP